MVLWFGGEKLVDLYMPTALHNHERLPCPYQQKAMTFGRKLTTHMS